MSLSKEELDALEQIIRDKRAGSAPAGLPTASTAVVTAALRTAIQVIAGTAICGSTDISKFKNASSPDEMLRVLRSEATLEELLELRKKLTTP